MSKSNVVILIQKHVRGYLCRKKLRNSQDQINFQMIFQLLENHKQQNRDISSLNSLLTKKKIRHTNFPSEISENIVKFIFYHRYKLMPTWDTDFGDLQCGRLRIEVKAFSSKGPTSFGPTEKWDRIYFVDALRFHESMFKVYECKLSNTSRIWQELKISKGATYGDHCRQGRRPRLCFSDIHDQLGDHCRLIFDGVFTENLCHV